MVLASFAACYVDAVNPVASLLSRTKLQGTVENGGFHGSGFVLCAYLQVFGSRIFFTFWLSRTTWVWSHPKYPVTVHNLEQSMMQVDFVVPVRVIILNGSFVCRSKINMIDILNVHPLCIL